MKLNRVIPVEWESRRTGSHNFAVKFEGVLNLLERRMKDAASDRMRAQGAARGSAPDAAGRCRERDPARACVGRVGPARGPVVVVWRLDTGRYVPSQRKTA
jgi:hypothetical protein